jgi:hypothetical protein
MNAEDPRGIQSSVMVTVVFLFSAGVERKKFTLLIIYCLDQGFTTKTIGIKIYIMFTTPKKIADKIGSAR